MVADGTEQDVARLDVAVDHAEVVHDRQRLADLQRQPQRTRVSIGWPLGSSSIFSCSVPRSATAITKYGRPSGSSSTSWTRTTRSWSMRRSSRASSMKRRRMSTLRAQLSASTLIATCTSSSSSNANHTVAKLPAPRAFSARYLPMRCGLATRPSWPLGSPRPPRCPRRAPGRRPKPTPSCAL